MAVQSLAGRMPVHGHCTVTLALQAPSVTRVNPVWVLVPLVIGPRRSDLNRSLPLSQHVWSFHSCSQWLWVQSLQVTPGLSGEDRFLLLHPWPNLTVQSLSFGLFAWQRIAWVFPPLHQE